jgi:hypothetical protein
VNRETPLCKSVRLAVNRTMRARIVRNLVGSAMMPSGMTVVVGLGTGSPDLVGVLANGRTFCIETKTLNGTARKSQIAWWRAAKKWNVLGGYARSVDNAMMLLAQAEAAASRESEALNFLIAHVRANVIAGSIVAPFVLDEVEKLLPERCE